MFDMHYNGPPPKKDWEDVIRYWKQNILPECIEKANKEGLGRLLINKDGMIEHTMDGSFCIQVTLCLGLITLRIFAETDYFEDYFLKFMDQIFAPFMGHHGI